jgi:hypothetical protein
MFDSLLWYSRYSVWVGAIVLFIQSLTGRSVGVISLLGVLMLAAGFAVFLGALSWEGLPEPAGSQPTERAAVELDVAAPAPALPAAEPLPEPATVAAPHIVLQTQRLAADSPLVGASCGVCAKRLRAEQVIVRCPDCGAVQHASCWTDNGFACAVEGCTGRGSLEAPA